MPANKTDNSSKMASSNKNVTLSYTSMISVLKHDQKGVINLRN